jgi:hypothetical protein
VEPAACHRVDVSAFERLQAKELLLGRCRPERSLSARSRRRRAIAAQIASFKDVSRNSSTCVATSGCGAEPRGGHVDALLTEFGKAEVDGIERAVGAPPIASTLSTALNL